MSASLRGWKRPPWVRGAGGGGWRLSRRSTPAGLRPFDGGGSRECLAILRGGLVRRRRDGGGAHPSPPSSLSSLPFCNTGEPWSLRPRPHDWGLPRHFEGDQGECTPPGVRRRERSERRTPLRGVLAVRRGHHDGVPSVVPVSSSADRDGVETNQRGDRVFPVLPQANVGAA